MDKSVKQTIKTGFELIFGNLVFGEIKYRKIISQNRLEFVKKFFLENQVVSLRILL